MIKPRELYYNYDELKKDIYYLKTVQLTITNLFEKSLMKEKTYEYRKFTKYVKENGITFKKIVCPNGGEKE